MQLVAVLRAVSQPSRSGLVFVQSPKPALHPVKVQVLPGLLPEHDAPVLCAASQVLAHDVQFVGVLSGDSQPLASEPVVSQLPKPVVQPV